MNAKAALGFALALVIASAAGCASSARRSGGPYQSGIASFYALSLAGRKTANGERFDPGARTCAHKKLPFGTKVRVYLLRTRTAAVCRVNDRGPYVDGRIIDLSPALAEDLGVKGNDIHKVEIRIEE
ncbi:MAG: septal ring lytic transglycosylase RlpA family protein [Deltaproteobacteria bacterium]|nr:septal ring lytic transglycosylase RlpA family protein [Deltaproteobacteria bacterium]